MTAGLRGGREASCHSSEANGQRGQGQQWPRGEDWELELDPPVNLVLPVSRDALAALWAAFGEE